MVSIRHKRSPAKTLTLPFPPSSSSPCPAEPEQDGQRLSDSSLAPSDGYSALFASGFLKQPYIDQDGPSPTLSSFPSPPKSIRGPFHPGVELSPERSGDDYSPVKRAFDAYGSGYNVSPGKSPRKRSSIIHTTSSSVSPRKVKLKGCDGGVERALDNVMRSLKVMAMGTPRKGVSGEEDEVDASRWSSSSEESIRSTCASDENGGGFWRPRKSCESSRSRITLRSVKSNTTLRSIKSKKSLKSLRQSDESERMDMDDVPPVPDTLPTLTPTRSRRMLQGIAKSLGLTPRKKKKTTSPEDTFPSCGLPQPPVDRVPPRKSSFSSLRSVLSRKTSTGTLRSTRSGSTHPFVHSGGPMFDCGSPPPLPPRWKEGYHGEGCLPPVTPKGRRTPKTSIGAPRLQASTSPSLFLKDQPRKAPGTPKDDDDLPSDFPPLPSLSIDTSLDSIFDNPSVFIDTPNATAEHVEPNDNEAIEIISFSTPLTAKAALMAESSASKPPQRLIDLLPRQQRINLGLRSPPSSGKTQLKTKQSTTPGVGSPARMKIGSNGLPAPKDSPKVLKLKRKPSPELPSEVSGTAPTTCSSVGRRSPFAPVHVNMAEIAQSSAATACASSHSINPSVSSQFSLGSVAGTFGTFGNTPPLRVKPRKTVPDFSASPDQSFNDTFRSSAISLASFDVDCWRKRFEAGLGRDWRSRFDQVDLREVNEDDMDTENSHVATEEWELEAYLKQLESVDGHSVKSRREEEEEEEGQYHGMSC
ncbi:hypothetical protein BD324DRAFT_62825 [Kockovaella imperatae]|uniref:Uncharacterized protein n=1 Tax=Kockovaella imperatae TaxID=4999 RepID=A0A1Y1UC30_9TREE|nr:hypothetical protein BD324DRAFT_62825 [Kockovaella imperatae]ORX35600.1 hypothetical protein BD324DRAFT_62825 [Kockovaella imperatae]